MFKQSAFIFVFLLSLALPGCVGPQRRPDAVIKPMLLDRITIEIVPTEDYPIDLKELKGFISNLEKYRICPESGVTVHVKVAVKTNKRSWSYQDIRAFEQKYRKIWDLDPTDRHLKLFVSCLRGRYSEPDKTSIIGLTYGRHSMSLFREHFDRALLLHETGHIIGLVDRRYRTSPPVNPDRPKHCNNNNCVMFWQVDQGTVFDENCARDILYMILEGVSFGGHIKCTNRNCTKVPFCTLPATK